MSNIKNFENIIADDTNNMIKKLLLSVGKNDEFEFIFFNNKNNSNANLDLEMFFNILEILKYRSNYEKLELIVTKTLDVSINIDNSTFRASISDLNNINKYITQFSNHKNHVIFKYFVELYKKNKSEINLIKKVKDMADIIEIPEFDIRLKKSKENKVSHDEINMLSSIDETKRDDVTYRFKERISLVIVNNDNERIIIDLTKIKMSKQIFNLESRTPKYELELELMTKKGTEKQLVVLYSEITKLLKIINGPCIITNTEKNEVLDNYKKMLDIDNKILKSLYMRKPESLEIQHVVDKLPNLYSVTDKADGDRYQIVIYNNSVYLISINLKIKKIDLTLPKNNKYNNTIIDGEYIYIPKARKYIFMAFDCLVKGGENIREISQLSERLVHLDDIIDNVFILEGQKGSKQKKLDTSNFTFNIEKINQFYEEDITNFSNNLNHDINIKKFMHLPIVRRKYFIFPLGRNENEIFQYSVLLWSLYVITNKVKYPYKLDGLIFTPIEQKYITNAKQSKFIDYKWKPEDKLSIDFYVNFEKNPEGKQLVAYDNTGEKLYSKDKPYKILQLNVGKVIKDVEVPVPFQYENDKHIAYIFLDNNEARDLEGKIIQDKTIVEFYYNNDVNLPNRYRWTPMRTRYDKTEHMLKYNKGFGNYIDIANKNWRSIENPFTFNDMLILSKDASYTKHIDVLRNKIDHSIIISDKQDLEYKRIINNLSKSLTNFENWIKSNTIYTYLNKIYIKGRQLNVLDFGFGRGEDIMRMYYVEVKLFVGLEKDNNSIISPMNGALSRYDLFRRRNPNFPPMSFINADVTVPLEIEEQERVIVNMTRQNKALMHKFFPKDNKQKNIFDCINCQLSIQYFASDVNSWSNFINNINLYLKPGGILNMSVFDADRIVELLKGKNEFKVEYVDEKGITKNFLEIIKKYDDKELYNNNLEIGIGKAIEVFNATISQENEFITEYLIQKKFLIKELAEKCNMELLDTDLYENLFHIQNNYVNNYTNYEANEKTRNFLTKTMTFYDKDNNINKVTYQIMRLKRFYAFRKKTTSVMKGGHTDTKLDIKKFFDNNFFRRKYNDLDNEDHTFLHSILDILKNSKMVPSNVTLEEFFDSDIKSDKNLDNTFINKICKNIVINHEIELDPDTEALDLSEVETTNNIINKEILNGINIIILDVKNKKLIANKYDSNNFDNYIILYLNNDKYEPIYKNIPEGITGIFNKKEKTIKKFL
ncbi:mRNA capping enzyme [Hokovirus HKV1]|uniref:mRNA capping enzyme n=1 Tax=Hokovirus HKV1 TaxID=1977638 RepID=A0A1V0SG12_9VIRU|nr:mRNA capping enzyme [Hokovirus HKV1]